MSDPLPLSFSSVISRHKLCCNSLGWQNALESCELKLHAKSWCVYMFVLFVWRKRPSLKKVSAHQNSELKLLCVEEIQRRK